MIVIRPAVEREHENFHSGVSYVFHQPSNAVVDYSQILRYYIEIEFIFKQRFLGSVHPLPFPCGERVGRNFVISVETAEVVYS